VQELYTSKFQNKKRHFGKEIIKSITNENETVVDNLYFKIYEKFIMEIDAIDNGVSITEGTVNYSISTGLSSRVIYSQFN
jgi:uncharacterized UPF0160 family protein